MIRAVLFDFGQTLVDSSRGFKQAEKEVQEKIFEALAVTDRERFMTHYRRIRADFHGRSDFSRYAMWDELYYYYCVAADSGHLREWEEDYWKTVKAGTRPFEETLEVLSSLERQYALALITNSQGQMSEGPHRITLFPDIEKFFKMIIVAGEGGIPAKPDPEPFRRCLELLGVSPGEAVYVGDDWRIDICGARSAGIFPIWLKHRSVKRNWPEMRDVVPIIDNLEPLLRLDQLLPD
jgi:putative hydrolase of the HAD superfamily